MTASVAERVRALLAETASKDHPLTAEQIARALLLAPQTVRTALAEARDRAQVCCDRARPARYWPAEPPPPLTQKEWWML